MLTINGFSVVLFSVVKIFTIWNGVFMSVRLDALLKWLFMFFVFLFFHRRITRSELWEELLNPHMQAFMVNCFYSLLLTWCLLKNKQKVFPFAYFSFFCFFAWDSSTLRLYGQRDVHARGFFLSFSIFYVFCLLSRFLFSTFHDHVLLSFFCFCSFFSSISYM